MPELQVFEFIKLVYPVTTAGLLTTSIGYAFGVLVNRFRLRLLEKRIEACHR